MKSPSLILLLSVWFYMASCSSVVTGNQTENTVTDNGIAGTYTGNIPCPHCSGIIYQLVLKPDSTYVEKLEYRGGSDPGTVTNQGTWRFKSTAIVQLLGKGDDNALFSAGNQQLTMLDSYGKVISGPTKDLYVLQKVD